MRVYLYLLFQIKKKVSLSVCFTLNILIKKLLDL